MNIIKSIKEMIAFHKAFKTMKYVRLADPDALDAYSFACCYRAQESVCRYYCSFYPSATFDDAMELIRYSQALRDTIKQVIVDAIVHSQPGDFDFTQDADQHHFFSEFGDIDQKLRIAKLYPQDYGIHLMDMLSLKVAQAYYLYLRQEKGYTKPWKEFNEQLLSDRNFYQPCFAGFKCWLTDLSFPSIVWSDKKVIGLMNEAKQRIETFGRQG